MAQNHFACPVCGVLTLLVYRVADLDRMAWPPGCLDPDCSGILELAPQPGDFAMDVGGVKGAAFRKFTVDVDGRPTEIDSLHTLRRVERESEQRYRNGEGEPLHFRMWHQDRSNRDVNTFGEAPTPPLEKSGKVSIRRHGETRPDLPLGPGLRRAASALPREPAG